MPHFCVANAWQIAGKPQKTSTERRLGKGEVDSSILSGSTTLTLENPYAFWPFGRCSVFADTSNKTRTLAEHGTDLRGNTVANRRLNAVESSNPISENRTWR